MRAEEALQLAKDSEWNEIISKIHQHASNGMLSTLVSGTDKIRKRLLDLGYSIEESPKYKDEFYVSWENPTK